MTAVFASLGVYMVPDFKVTPWEVTGDIDYDVLVERFGTTRIDDALLDRLSSYGDVHPLLKRGIFYSHRDFNLILDAFEKGEGFVLYTGRGPSGDTHLGHLLPWLFTKWLQDVFDVELYFQLTDDEKFLFKQDLSLNDTRRMAYENALDMAAVGFDRDKTKIILDTANIQQLYPLALKVSKKVTFSTARAVFGFDNSNNIGSIFYTAIQAAPCFLASEEKGRNVACLIPCGIDQDPHFRVTRDVAPGLGYLKPAMLHNKMFPSLNGADKMSSSDPDSTVFTTDSKKTVKSKIGKAFTGGCVSAEEQRGKGGNPEVCAIFKYQFYLFEEDDRKLDDLVSRCRSGDILCGECKKHLTEKVNLFLEQHQKRREEARAYIGDMTYCGFEW
ncbi:MAG: tryptophan--tRNA ligase [Candidatus Methanomethylophilaceae archaeon]|nr:tryptophan--tRNA ligase [Candidatus Methanomethylophilaceae archaeon]